MNVKIRTSWKQNPDENGKVWEAPRARRNLREWKASCGVRVGLTKHASMKGGILGVRMCVAIAFFLWSNTVLEQIRSFKKK